MTPQPPSALPGPVEVRWQPSSAEPLPPRLRGHLLPSRRQSVAGAVAAVVGLAGLVLAAVFGPEGATSWVILGGAAGLLAIHPALRSLHLVLVVAVLVLAAVRAGTSGLPLALAAVLGLTMFGYVLSLDLAAAVGDDTEPIRLLLREWFEAVRIPVAAGLAGTAVAAVAAVLPLPPSLPLALAGLAALVGIAAIAFRWQP